MKKNPTTIFIQLLRTKTIKKNSEKYSENKYEKRRKKKNLTLMWLQVKPRREKKIRKVY